MSRIETIFKQVRSRVADINGDRWTNEYLVDFLNEAQKDLCKRTDILQDKIAFKPVRDIHTYVLPNDTLKTLRISYKQEKLKMVSQHYMDSKRYPSTILGDFNYYDQYGASSFSSSGFSNSNDWEEETTTKDFVLTVFDDLRRQRLRLWPMPTEDNFLTSAELGTFYIPAGSADTSAYAASLGYGVLSDFETDSPVVVTRSRMPLEIALEDISEEVLEVDPICDDALRAYMVYRAFENDIKESNRELATRNWTIYQADVNYLQAMVASSSVSSNVHDTMYNGMG